MSLTSETVRHEDVKYCICRASYGNKFMIACDRCEEWFHGSCININSEQAKDVDQYFCPFCKEKDPSLKTVYKKSKEKDRDKQKEKLKDKHKEKLKRKEKRREDKRNRIAFDSESEEDADQSASVSKRKFDHPEEQGKDERTLKQSVDEMKPKIIKEEIKIKHSENEESLIEESNSKQLQLQLEITSKLKIEEPAKFKIPKESQDATKQKIFKGQPQKPITEEIKIPKQIKDEKYKFVRDEKQKFLDKLKLVKEEKLKVAKEEKLKIFKEERSKTVKDDKQKPPKEEKIKLIKEEKVSDPINAREKKVEDIIKMKAEDLFSSSKEETKTSRGERMPSKEERKLLKDERKSIYAESDDDADFDSFLNALSKQSKPKSAALSTSEDEDVDVGTMDVAVDTVKKVKLADKDEPLVAKPHKTALQATKRPGKGMKTKGRPRKQMGAKNSMEVGQNETVSSEEEEAQCLGPGCCTAARSRSRYCSEECGVSLAVKRIKTFMPDRKLEMKRGGVARGFDEAQITDLEKQQEIAHQKIEVLQNERLVIMNLMKNAKADITDHYSEEDMSDEDSAVDNEEIDCVICGMACTDKSAARHMERCYNKFESKLALGSTVKCHVTWESPVCDAYDRQQGTYCKKLRVLCPDHNKEKEDHNGICGCPLELSNICYESAVCRKSKRSCNKHIGWEKLRLAEIDMQRVLQDLKLEDSFEEMRKVKYRMANRTNLLQILLNGTILHGEDFRAVT